MGELSKRGLSVALNRHFPSDRLLISVSPSPARYNLFLLILFVRLRYIQAEPIGVEIKFVLSA